MFRKAQEGASSYSVLNTNLKIVFFENPRGARYISLIQIMHVEKPKRVLHLILF